MDNLTEAQRSRNMSMIRSAKTKPELKLRSVLKALGFQYQPQEVFGKPDFGNKQKKIAVFIDGCFWHGCPEHGSIPKSNKAYWIPKIERNIARDKEVNQRLESQNWRVIRVWEHALKRL